MKIGYFPGCSLGGTAKEFDLSLRAVMKALGVELVEIDDWSCCGASSAHATNRLLAVALPARNLLLAAEQGLAEIVAPCAACYSRLVVAQHEVAHDPGLKAKVERAIESPLPAGEIRILNVVELFERIGAERLRAARQVDLGGLNIAAYYGCLLVRPNEITGFDDAEQPVIMDEILRATGARLVDWNFKTECCGGAHSISHKPIVTKLSKKILDDARQSGANVVAVACPMCHSNLDMRQVELRKQGAHQDLPILYLTELFGLALGLGRKELGLDLHFVPLPANALAAAPQENRA